MKKIALLASIVFLSGNAFAGAQKYEELKAKTKQLMSQSVSDVAPDFSSFSNKVEEYSWLSKQSKRLSKRIPDESERLDLLKSIHYEATRAGLDPQLVLGLIHVESRFNKYAVSSVGARGFMQVMPFWVDIIGEKHHNLFHLRTNLRYGCTILRHYLDIEKGNMFRALGRYNGSLGKAAYPDAVTKAMTLYQ
jgi:soluble lytic murein transglycosylase-like protein